MDVPPRVAVVTGAAKGIGFATARRLSGEGVAVVAIDADASTLEAAGRRLDAGAGVLTVAADVSDPSEVGSAIEQALDRFARIDVLVNNAGIAGRSVPTWKVTDDDWNSVMAVNLTGAFLCTRAVLPTMRARGYGRIVNVASIAGKEGNPNAVPYSASKAGLIGLTKAVAKEVATDNILVNCVTPAVIQTGILEQVSDQHLRYMLNRIPMGRAGAPEEVAELIAWLASERCSFSTGAVFDISGGRATY